VPINALYPLHITDRYIVERDFTPPRQLFGRMPKRFLMVDTPQSPRFFICPLKILTTG